MPDQPEDTDTEKESFNLLEDPGILRWVGLATAVLLVVYGILQLFSPFQGVSIFFVQDTPTPSPTNTAVPTNTPAATATFTATAEPTATETPSPTVVINNPEDNASVESSIQVAGTYLNVNDDDEIWVIVQAVANNRYYPHREAATKDSGDWRSPVDVGDGISGEAFIIHVAVVNSVGQVSLETYARQGLEENNWPGFESLPEGVYLQDEISVTSE